MTFDPSEFADVLVVGGGSAGAVLAARLRQDPARTVVLVKAGPAYDNGGYPASLLDAGAIADADHDWGLHLSWQRRRPGDPHPSWQGAGRQFRRQCRGRHPRSGLRLRRPDRIRHRRLRQFRLAVIGWLPEPARPDGPGDELVRLERLGHALGIGLGCIGRPLFVPVDEALAWFWLPFGASQNLDWARLDVIVEAADPTVRVAVGELEKAVEGFRASHRQALTAQNVALAAEPPRRVTPAERVGPIALMCRDLDAARVWVRKALGSLATDKNNNRLLRETLRVFLETGGSYVAAAEALNLHRNTVQYRLRKAGELLPTPIADRRSDLELALRACEQLGSALLGDNEVRISVRNPRRHQVLQPPPRHPARAAVPKHRRARANRDVVDDRRGLLIPRRTGRAGMPPARSGSSDPPRHPTTTLRPGVERDPRPRTSRGA